MDYLFQKKELEVLHKEIIDDNYDLKEQIVIEESIKTCDDTQTNETSLSVINMVTTGFEQIQIDYIEDRNEKVRLDSLINAFYTNLLTMDFNDLKNEVSLYNNKYSVESFKYIFNSLLIKLQNKIYEAATFYNDKAFYLDEDLKQECLKEYNIYLDLYLKIRNYLDESLLEYYMDLFTKQMENKDPVNQIYFAIPPKDDISFFERDIKGISKESLSDILDLLVGFEQGKVANTKSLSSKDKALEIKHDQVRIVYTHVEGNKFLISGVFIKKADNDRVAYEKLIKRFKTIDESSMTLEQTLSVKKRLLDYINENKRQNTR